MPLPGLAASGTPAVISSVSDRSAAALRELERLCLLPGTALVVEKRNPAASLAIRIEFRPGEIRLNRDLAACILVTPRPPAAA